MAAPHREPTSSPHVLGHAREMATATGDRTFWEHRLAEDWNQAGVGYRALGLPFSTWMYRVRREVFLREADALGLDPRSARVLDVGSGTGFYIRRWLELGVGSVRGCDLTESALDRLRSPFPSVEIHRVDIADPADAIPRGLLRRRLLHRCALPHHRRRPLPRRCAPPRPPRPSRRTRPAVRELRPRAGAARPAPGSIAR